MPLLHTLSSLRYPITRRAFSHTSRIMASSPPLQQEVRFPKSPVPPNPLGEGRSVNTAACLIIGDEVLNGKTRDSNSNYLAKFLFELGIELKRIEVIADEEDEIIDAARRLVAKYDFVVTSGGIGPTHDDITYASLAKAFDDAGELVYHDETLRRMDAFHKLRYLSNPNAPKPTEEQTTARKRMALFPAKGSEVLFVQENLWVPVVRLQGKLIILPGIPKVRGYRLPSPPFEQGVQIFEPLLDGMADYLPLPPTSSKPFRHLIHTLLPESSIAPFLTKLAERVKQEGIRVGSYPKFAGGVDVSLIGKDLARLKELGLEVAQETQGSVLEADRVGGDDSKL